LFRRSNSRDYRRKSLSTIDALISVAVVPAPKMEPSVSDFTHTSILCTSTDKTNFKGNDIIFCIIKPQMRRPNISSSAPVIWLPSRRPILSQFTYRRPPFLVCVSIAGQHILSFQSRRWAVVYQQVALVCKTWYLHIDNSFGVR
jgi:hypothetical protein